MWNRNLHRLERFKGALRKHLIFILTLVATVTGPLTAIALAAGTGGGGLGGASASAADACATATTPTAPASGTTTPAVTTPTTSTFGGGGAAGAGTATGADCTTTTVAVPVPTFTTTTPTTTSTPSTPGSTVTQPSTVTTTTPAKTTTYPYTPPTNTAPAPAIIPVPKSNPFAQRGMWIWVMSATDHGNVAQIASEAKSYGIGTLLIKSGDGTTYWNQFSPTLVQTLHADGLKVCAWQYVYGINPAAEAKIGARAVQDGADCLVIDAETQYQGKYVQAQTYMTDLRAAIGANFPVGLAGFPYVDYHLSFPYSVFLGPGGAQYNVPQMYWQDIGVSPATIYSVTYQYNEIYQRPIFPLGQLYDNPPNSAIAQFRTLATKYGATGVSWWDWQSSGPAQLDAMTIPGTLPKNFVRQRTAAAIAFKSQGDLVLWAQEHLAGGGYKVSIDGDYGTQTRTAVTNFQRQHGLPASGEITGATWNALLKIKPVAVKWVQTKTAQLATVVKPGSGTGATGATGGGAGTGSVTGPGTGIAPGTTGTTPAATTTTSGATTTFGTTTPTAPATTPGASSTTPPATTTPATTTTTAADTPPAASASTPAPAPATGAAGL